MLANRGFAQAAYTLFTVAVLAALLKLGGISGVGPPALQAAPSTSAAKAEEAAPARKEAPGSKPRRLVSRTPEPPTRLKAQKNDAPVFYRPSPGSMRGANGNSDGPVCGDLGDFPKSSKAVFPLPGVYFNSYEDTWGAPRPQGAHEGTDLMSSAGTPEFAITDGTIVPVSGANNNGWNRLGGYTVMLEAAYDVGPIEKGDLFYYAHMDQKSTLPIGSKVQAGQQIGVVGDTGEGPEITQGKFPPHLHLGWYDTSSSAITRTNLKSGAMNPYPLLVWLEENGGGVTGGTDAAYCKAPQGPTPDLPGARPDLDPGNAYDARPSPIIVGERDDHRFPEPENASESGTDEKDRPGTFGGWIGATDAGTNAGSADSSAKEDMAKDSHGGSSTPVESGRARSGDQASRSSAEDDPPGSSPQKKARSLPPERLSSWPDRTMWRYHASILAHALRRAEIRKPEITKDRNDEKNASKKEGDGRDAGIPEKKKQKEEVKEFANPLEESKEPEENRSVSETDTAQQRPAPREKDTTNARSFGENPKASPTKQPRHRSRSASSSANPKEGKTASSTEDAR